MIKIFACLSGKSFFFILCPLEKSCLRCAILCLMMMLSDNVDRLAKKNEKVYNVNLWNDFFFTHSITRKRKKNIYIHIRFQLTGAQQLIHANQSRHVYIVVVVVVGVLLPRMMREFISLIRAPTSVIRYTPIVYLSRYSSANRGKKKIPKGKKK